MSLVSRLATANQPVGIKTPSSPDIESDLPAGDPTEVVQQPAQIISQANPACLTPESAHHLTAQITVGLKLGRGGREGGEGRKGGEGRRGKGRGGEERGGEERKGEERKGEEGFTPQKTCRAI